MKAVSGHGGRAAFVTEALLKRVTTKAIMGQTQHSGEQSMAPYSRTSAEAERVLQDVIAGKHRKKSVPHATRKDPRKCHGRKGLRKDSSPPESPTKMCACEAKKPRGADRFEKDRSVVEIKDSDNEKSVSVKK